MGCWSPAPGTRSGAAATLNRNGAHAARIDLPLHLRRRRAGTRSGVGYVSADLRWTRESSASRWRTAPPCSPGRGIEVSDRWRSRGTSLGGLIAAACSRPSSSWTVWSPSPPSATRRDAHGSPARAHPPRDRRPGGRRRRRLGPPTAMRARRGRGARPHRASHLPPPVTPREGDRHRPPHPGRRRRRRAHGALAQTWGAELWSYRQGHISVMNAPGLSARDPRLAGHPARRCRAGAHARGRRGPGRHLIVALAYWAGARPRAAPVPRPRAFAPDTVRRFRFLDWRLDPEPDGSTSATPSTTRSCARSSTWAVR